MPGTNVSDAPPSGMLTVNPDPLSWVVAVVLLCFFMLLPIFECSYGERLQRWLRPTMLAQTGGEVKDVRPFWHKMTVFMLSCMATFAGELYYSIIIPYLPSEVEDKGLAPAINGLLISCHALGVIVFSPFAPLLLRHYDPFALLRVVLSSESVFSLLCALCAGLSSVSFAVIFALLRFVLGGHAAVLAMCAQAIGFRMAPVRHVAGATAAIVATTTIGSMLGPMFGGLLYSAQPGGFALPFVVLACLFATLYVILYIVNTQGPGMAPIPSSASVVQVLTIWQVWVPLIASPFLVGVLPFLLEPLYNPVLSSAPYELGYKDIGFAASVSPVVATVTLILAGSWLHTKIGACAQQLLGGCVICLSALLLGPSPIFGSALPKSLALFIGALCLTGIGSAMVMPVNTIFILRIVERETGMTKDQMGGVASTLSTALLMISALIAPPVGSSLYGSTLTFEWLTTGWAICFAAIFFPCVLFLCSYRDALPRKL